MSSIRRATKTFKNRVSLKMSRRTCKGAKASPTIPIEADSADDTTIISPSITEESIHTLHESSPSSQSAFLISEENFSVQGKVEPDDLSLNFHAIEERPAIKTPALPRLIHSNFTHFIAAQGPISNDTEHSVNFTITPSGTGKGLHTRWSPPVPRTPSLDDKLMVTIPAAGKRSRSAEDIPKTVSNRRRLQRHCDSAPSDAIVHHSNPASHLIYSGRDSFGAPVVITTSFTGDGKHTRWLYPIEQPLSPHSCCSSDIEADDEASTDSDDASSERITIVIPPLKSLKCSPDSDDDEDYVALRTRSRLRASASHSSLASSSTLSTFSESSTNSSTNSVQYPRVSFFRDSRAPSPSLRLRLLRPNVSFKKEDAF